MKNDMQEILNTIKKIRKKEKSRKKIINLITTNFKTKPLSVPFYLCGSTGDR